LGALTSVRALTMHAEAKKHDALKQKKVSALRKALSMYSGRLGLEFKQGTGGWVFLSCKGS